MTPDIVLSEMRHAMTTGLLVSAPPLLTVLAVGIVIGIVQAATQINEPTIAFVAKAIALAAVMTLAGGWMMGAMVDFTADLIQRIPALVNGA
ncbi:MAG: flagellar biosynthetic protein FliQ [Pseudomonadota bacterium]